MRIKNQINGSIAIGRLRIDLDPSGGACVGY